jgi:pyrroline-5-carboxylate reductase
LEYKVKPIGEFRKMILFLGTGKMASAIAGGMVKAGTDPNEIGGYDVNDSALQLFSKNTGATSFTDIKNAISASEVIVLAVKPQHFTSAVSGKADLFAGKLVISIMAGVKISSILDIISTDRVIRVMPNTPALVGEGASAFAASHATTDVDVELAEQILSAIGKVYKVSEEQLDAVTGLSGSGPAYVFNFIQSLADGGVRMGLTRDVALNLAAQTVLGAAKMVVETGEHPAVLADQVTSPGGTTAAGLAALEDGAFRSVVSSAVKSATERSKELGAK